MSTVIAPSEQTTRTRPAARRKARRAERRRLKRLDLLSGRLAELHAISALLDQSAEVVGRGWIQGAWFSVATRHGDRPVTAYDLRLAEDGPVVGACLVGAVVHGAGGPSTVRSQLVQRTLDLTWHALREGSEQQVEWCPGQHIRMMRVLDLTHWNDAAARTRDDVVELFRTAGRAAEVQRDLCRAERAELSALPALPVG